MEEVLDTPFYQDDILSRTITTSVLYDKSSLDLSFQPTCHPDNSKTEHDVPTMVIQQNPNNSESPNLDFLKFGSPDLEKMFMNFQGSETNSPVQDQTVTFALAANDPICATENSFTNALQQLHDQQDGPEQASVLERFPESHEAISLLDRKHAHDVRQHHEAIMHQEQRQHLSNRRQDISENSYINTSNCNALNNSNMHVASDGTILACSPPDISQRVVPQNLPLALQSQHAQEAVVFHNFNLLNNNPPPIPGQIMRPVEHPHFYGHNMTSFHERETMHNVYDFQMHDGSNQGGPLRGLPPKFHDGGFVEQAIGEQMTLGGIDNMSGMGMEDQPKLYVENSHMQPINLEIQELVKRERKKLRNRIASSKCRKRKLEREARLEDRVKDLKEKNIELNAVSNALKQQVCDLKQRVMDHVSEGCQIVLPPS